MLLHASCAARDGAGVIITGPSGCGKSDLLLRLLSFGFVLVADDQVFVEQGYASAPERLAGLIEVRGLGIIRMPFCAGAELKLLVELKSFAQVPRLPEPKRDDQLALPAIVLDAFSSSAPHRTSLALDCLTGRREQIVGAFAA